MRKNWVNPSDITVVQCPTLDDFLARKDDIDAVYGEKQTPDFWDYACNYYPFFWIFYLKLDTTTTSESIPVGIIRRDFFTRSVELHGSCRDGYQAKGIEYYATLACLNDLFIRHKFSKVTIPVPNGNVATTAFARRWGFTKTDYREGDVTYWRLKRDQYMERINNGRQGTQSESSDIPERVR